MSCALVVGEFRAPNTYFRPAHQTYPPFRLHPSPSPNILVLPAGCKRKESRQRRDPFDSSRLRRDSLRVTTERRATANNPDGPEAGGGLGRPPPNA